MPLIFKRIRMGKAGKTLVYYVIDLSLPGVWLTAMEQIKGTRRA